MKRTVALLVTLLALVASPAAAQGGLNLFWNGCSLDHHSYCVNFDCGSNTGTFVLVASIAIPADMPKFTAATAILNVDYLFDAPIPAWWQTESGQCRERAIGMTFESNVIATNCPAIWEGGQVVSVHRTRPHPWLPNLLRIEGAAALPMGQEKSLLGDGTEWNLCWIIISRAKSTGADACAGCTQSARIAFVESRLQQPVGVGDYYVTNVLESNWVEWQVGYDCVVPVQNRTWGAIKGLYR